MTTEPTKPTTGTVDWDRIARRLGEVKAHMIHHEERQLYGTAFEAEALRRTFGYVPVGEHGYDHLRTGCGLTTDAYAEHLYSGNALVDRLNLERAEAKVKEMRAEVRRVYAEARKDIANYLRDWCNERTVPSRYRREGVQQVINLLDPPTREVNGGEVR